jgi:hypothetical protein
VSDLRAVNARLRQVVAGKDELIASQDTMIRAQGEQSANQPEMIRLQSDRMESQDELVGTQGAAIEQLLAEVGELKRRLSMDSSNSSTPPSADSIAAKAKRRKANSERKRSKDRQPGEQKGHPGSGLELAPEVDDTVPVEPGQCSTCGEHLNTGSPCEGFTPVQQWDIPPVKLNKIEFDLMRRRCSAGHLTQALAPVGVAGPVCYGPNVRAFTAHIAYRGHVSRERTAQMLAELVGTPVSTGFVASCVQRLSARLAGFEADLKQALITAP